MIISKRLEDAEYIMSKDELTYSAVIEDFKNASQIHILTYNISKDQNVLLKALKDCEKDTEICIVSNIPGRWESYFRKTYADKAKRNISLYKSKLSPQKIADKAEVYFCFSNHAKIIMTDNIAYSIDILEREVLQKNLLLLTGVPFSGKTYIAKTIAQELQDNGYYVKLTDNIIEDQEA